MGLSFLYTVVVAFVLLPVHARRDYKQDGISSIERGTQTIDAGKCSKNDISVSQSQTYGIPQSETNGIPVFSVQITNQCRTECDISNIHLSCGAFSSATLINRKVFKRLQINDCLVNDGQPLKFGSTIAFTYETSFKYPLSVASVTC